MDVHVNNTSDIEDERDSGVRGFGSALQAILRYLGASLGASQQDVHAERLQSNSRAESSGRQEQTPVFSLGRAGWKLFARHFKALCTQHFPHGQLCALSWSDVPGSWSRVLITCLHMDFGNTF